MSRSKSVIAIIVLFAVLGCTREHEPHEVDELALEVPTVDDEMAPHLKVVIESIDRLNGEIALLSSEEKDTAELQLSIVILAHKDFNSVEDARNYREAIEGLTVAELLGRK